jgi:hypothetical protein
LKFSIAWFRDGEEISVRLMNGMIQRALWSEPKRRPVKTAFGSETDRSCELTAVLPFKGEIDDQLDFAFRETGYP